METVRGMRVPMRPNSRVGHSVVQGVGENAESEGPEEGSRQARAKAKRQPASARVGTPLNLRGNQCREWCRMRDADMTAWGPHPDLGKSSVFSPRVEERAHLEGSELAKARDSEVVGELKEANREDHGGTWSCSTDGATRNGRSGKCLWLSEEELRIPTDDVRNKLDVWWGTLPSLFSKRSKGGEAGRVPNSFANPREGGGVRPHHPNKSRQRNSGNPTTTLKVADGGACATPSALYRFTFHKGMSCDGYRSVIRI